MIACGGGGIPVVYHGTRYEGVDAVIDKDFAASKMATLIEADVFVILTAVDCVYVNFGKENQQALKEISLVDMQKYIAEKQFPAGSMLPKVEAACEFVSSGKEKTAIIANLEQVAQAITAEAGTIIRL